MRYAIEQRLRLIDFLLQQYGYVNRSALCNYFGVSIPQASQDLADYLALAPANAAYDKKAKRYVRMDTFKEVYA